MRMSAFGVEDTRISKADRKKGQDALAVTSGTVGGAGGVAIGNRKALGDYRNLTREGKAESQAARDVRGLAAGHERLTEEAVRARRPDLFAEHRQAARRLAPLAEHGEKASANLLGQASKIRRVVGPRLIGGAAAGALGAAGLGLATRNRNRTTN